MTFNEWWVANVGSSNDADGWDCVAEEAWNAALDEAIKLTVDYMLSGCGPKEISDALTELKS